MSSSSYSYHVISDKEGNADRGPQHQFRVERGSLKQRIYESAPRVIILCSILLNLSFVAFLGFYPFETTISVSKYARLPRDHIRPYYHNTPYSSTNSSEADFHWDQINTNPGAIALSDDYVRSQGLEPAARFPWDDNMGLYYIKGFHDLHCLKLLRRSISQYRTLEPQTVPEEHIGHCLDSLRQSVLCAAEDMPMAAVPDRPGQTGDDTPMQCRDWSRLERWATDPERSGCYDIIDEYKPVVNGIELFAFCEPGSRHYGAMSRYFERHGHRDPWSD